MRLQACSQKIEQTVKLIRSKGVGIYFVTQNPLDIPESVLAQMGNRVQHALRAYTPREQKAVQVGGLHLPAQPGFQDRRGHHRSLARARRWSPCSIPRACPPWWNAP